MPKEKFEDALSKLEKIVNKLEEGDLSLDESLKYFEEGIRLYRLCSERLEEAEKKVEILLREKDGGLKAEPFLGPENDFHSETDRNQEEPADRE